MGEVGNRLSTKAQRRIFVDLVFTYKYSYFVYDVISFFFIRIPQFLYILTNVMCYNY